MSDSTGPDSNGFPRPFSYPLRVLDLFPFGKIICPLHEITPLVIKDFRSQMLISGIGPFLFPSDKSPSGHHEYLETAWRRTLKRAGVSYFRSYDLRSTYATRLSAGGVANEWVTLR